MKEDSIDSAIPLAFRRKIVGGCIAGVSAAVSTAWQGKRVALV